MSGLIIVGAGGHSKVVYDAAREMGLWDRYLFVDGGLAQDSFLGWPLVKSLNDSNVVREDYKDLVVAIGSNQVRHKLLMQYAEQGFNLPVIKHPTAYISRGAVVQPGTVVLAQAAVNYSAQIGLGCIVNTSASIDHDCQLGCGVHLSPGVRLAGGVKIGNFSWVGIGSSVIQHVAIGENVIIGAQTAVIRDIEDNVTVVGVPGRIIKRHG
ncbi:MAG: acetyltransferase [Bacillota bacterium]|uniref:PglD N-terminal domain-containing protein n=1 Tax=Thermanaerosceptrum fracticalcis TaxID=1712410 RepID=A0A7G6E4J5_THEFR|nr:acetyltransferase [Thermanaerosceptrum fracticalcis]QNB46999.1 hypothetical protein BR63_12185 [Thermanaerosceptrum fracticalcis]